MKDLTTMNSFVSAFSCVEIIHNGKSTVIGELPFDGGSFQPRKGILKIEVTQHLFELREGQDPAYRGSRASDSLRIFITEEPVHGLT